jgi:hypothetical protein
MVSEFPYRYAWRLTALWGPQGSPLFDRRCPPLKRSTVTIPRRRKRPRRVSVLRDQPYKDWLKKCRCVVCSILKLVYRDRLCASGSMPIDPAHTVNNGMSSKGPDNSCVPLCRVHHREYDAGREAFEVKYGISMQRESAAHYLAFEVWKEDQ